MNLIQKIMSMFNPMLSCEEVNEFVIDYLEGNLPESMRRKFEAHLEKCECPNCRTYLEQYNKTVTVVNQDGQIEIPQDIAQVTLAFLQEHLPQD